MLLFNRMLSKLMLATSVNRVCVITIFCENPQQFGKSILFREADARSHK